MAKKIVENGKTWSKIQKSYQNRINAGTSDHDARVALHGKYRDHGYLAIEVDKAINAISVGA